MFKPLFGVDRRQFTVRLLSLVIWAILIIALDIWVIWALTRHVEKVQEL